MLYSNGRETDRSPGLLVLTGAHLCCKQKEGVRIPYGPRRRNVDVVNEASLLSSRTRERPHHDTSRVEVSQRN